MDELILRPLAEGCATFPVNVGYGFGIPALRARSESISACKTGVPSARTLGSFMLAFTPSRSQWWFRREP